MRPCGDDCDQLHCRGCGCHTVGNELVGGACQGCHDEEQLADRQRWETSRRLKEVAASLTFAEAEYDKARLLVEEAEAKWAEFVSQQVKTGRVLSRVVWRVLTEYRRDKPVYVIRSVEDDPAAKELIALLPASRRFDLGCDVPGLKVGPDGLSAEFAHPDPLLEFLRVHAPKVVNAADNALHRDIRHLREQIAALDKCLAAMNGQAVAEE